MRQLPVHKRSARHEGSGGEKEEGGCTPSVDAGSVHGREGCESSASEGGPPGDVQGLLRSCRTPGLCGVHEPAAAQSVRQALRFPAASPRLPCPAQEGAVRLRLPDPDQVARQRPANAFTFFSSDHGGRARAWSMSSTHFHDMQLGACMTRRNEHHTTGQAQAPSWERVRGAH